MRYPPRVGLSRFALLVFLTWLRNFLDERPFLTGLLIWTSL